MRPPIATSLNNKKSGTATDFCVRAEASHRPRRGCSGRSLGDPSLVAQVSGAVGWASLSETPARPARTVYRRAYSQLCLGSPWASGAILATGMTLVELLLALTLFSTLMASATSLLRSGLQAQVMWGSTLVPYQQAERALQRLEDDLEATQPFFGVIVVGESSQLEVARVVNQQWVRVEYQIQEIDGEQWLTREETLWGEEEPLQSERLLRVTNGSFAFGMLDAQNQLLWEPSWDGLAHGMPRLVKVTCVVPLAGAQGALEVSRVIRNPAGGLPTLEPE